MTDKDEGGPAFRVYWIPQLPMKGFIYAVPDLATGKLLADALARYDLFQFENNVKPDYCNTGGVEWKHPHFTGDVWESWPDDEDEEAILLHDIAAREGK